MQFCNLTTNHVNCGQLCLLENKKKQATQKSLSQQRLSDISQHSIMKATSFKKQSGIGLNLKNLLLQQENVSERNHLCFLIFTWLLDVMVTPHFTLSFFLPLPFHIKSALVQLDSEQGPRIRNHRQ